MADKDEKELRERKNTDLETALTYMNPIHTLMDKYYEMYRNRNNDCSFNVSDLFTYVETVVPILTNNRVRASVHSDYPEYIRHAQGLNDILDHTYDINHWDYESQEIARMAEIYRSAMAYSGYDGDYKNGTGRVCLKGVNIRWCYLDPSPTKFEDSSFFFYVEPMRKSKVIAMHPEKKAEIEQTVGKRDSVNVGDGKNRRWFQTLYSSVKNFITFSGNKAGITDSRFYELMELDEEQKRKNSVAYIHYWYRDNDDKWRVSYWADDVLLQDIPNPNWHEQLPYDIYNPTKDILSSMGIPMGEHIQNLNDERNLLLQYIMENARLHADPPQLYNTAYGNVKDPEAMSEPKRKNGMIAVNNPDMVPLNAIREILQPPAMPGYAVDMPERLLALEDRITGVNDSFRGMSEATSGKEVQLKQEAAYTRIKTKVDNFELFNKKIAEKLIVLVMQHYSETRAFRIKGDYKRYEDLISGQTTPDAAANPFEVEPIQKGMNPETGEPEYDRTEFYMYANPGEWAKLMPDEADQPEKGEDPQKQEAQNAYKVLQMTVEIEAGSSLPVSRMARREEALELLGAGVLDQQAVLDEFDWPNREDIIKRMAEAAAAQQEAQMKAEQMKMEQQMQMKQLDMQHQAAMNQQNNEAKKEKTQMKNEAKAQQGNQPDLASELDALREAFPELANMSDEKLAEFVARLSVQ